LPEQEGIGARTLEFLILTATRTGEIIGATLAEIDFEQRLWTVPGSRMKTGREHRVPLSGPALAILRPLAETKASEFLFPGSRVAKGLSNMAMLKLLQRMGRSDLTAHGFRSTFSDWCAEQTAFPSEVREMALAHTVSDRVEAAYRRGDMFAERRQLMDAWAAYCDLGEAGSNVIAFAQGDAHRLETAL
jgi:integrase